ncbi:MAG: DUF389 domain-containing protein [Planctomycetes bacterium]|nr:DUF389 domain-containing protein [Planctomycetota bacterium]
MSVLVVVRTPEEASPLVFWAARFAAARNKKLTVLCPTRSAQPQEAKKLPLHDATDEHPLRSAARAAIRGVQSILILDGGDSELELDLEKAAAEPAGDAARDEAPTAAGGAEPEQPPSEPNDAVKPTEGKLTQRFDKHVELVGISHPDIQAGTLAELKRRHADLTVIGYHEGVRGEETGTTLSGQALEVLPGEVLILRASGESGQRCNSILLPTSGGPHAAVALRLAHDVAKRSGGRLVPLYVEPEFGELSEAAGHVALERALKAAKLTVDVDHVTPRVVVADKPQHGITQAAREGHDLVIVGASDTTKLHRALFGTVPERVLREEKQLAVGVFRSARALSSRTWEAVVEVLTQPFPTLSREERLVLFDRLGEGSSGNVDFMVLISLSTAIACLGLLQDSTAVVIGAMLVAPLMTPMIGSGFALVQGNLVLMRRAALTIVMGFLIALAIGTGFGLVYFYVAPDIGLTSEILARGRPNLLDLVVAFLSGLAAAYALARPNLMGAMAGVAIAAALVPPIGSAGLSFAAGEYANGRGAAFLFGVNLLAIVFGAAVAFGMLGIRAQRNQASALTRWGRIALLFGTALVAIPLSGVLIAGFSRKQLERTIRVTPGLTLALERELIVMERESFVPTNLSLVEARNLRVDATADLKVVVACAGPVLPTLPDRLKGAAERYLGHPVRLRLVLLRAEWFQTSNGGAGD